MINKEMMIAEVLELDTGVVPIFLKHGLHCMGCALSRGETVEEACEVHGLNLDHLMSDLHAYFGDEEAAD